MEKFYFVGRFAECGVAPASKLDEKGIAHFCLIDREGNIVIPFDRFSWIGEFNADGSLGAAQVSSGKYFFIDAKGNYTYGPYDDCCIIVKEDGRHYRIYTKKNHGRNGELVPNGKGWYKETWW